MPGQESGLAFSRKRSFDDGGNHGTHEPETLRKQPRSLAGSVKTNSSNSSSKTLVPLGGVELFHINVAAAKESSPAIVPTSDLSFSSEISESDREAIDRSLIPWDFPSSTTEHWDDLANGDKVDPMLRLPFSLVELAPQRPKMKRSTGPLDVRRKGDASTKPISIKSAPSTARLGDLFPKPNPGLALYTTSKSLPTRKGIWDVSTAATPPLKIGPPPLRKVDKPLPIPSPLPAPTPLALPTACSPPLLPLPLPTPTKPTPLLPKPSIPTSSLGPINLIDPHTGKILSTRHPNGGYGYDPAVNWTPETSFSDGGSRAPSETLVPINPGSKVLVPRNRIPRDERYPWANWEALWGAGGGELATPGGAENEDDGDEEGGDDDDAQTVVASEPDNEDDDEDTKTICSSSPSSQNSFVPKEILNLDTSFSDVLVFRHEGDTSFSSPSTKPCSAAAHMLDIAAVKFAAERLFEAHEKSGVIYLRLANWLEGVVLREMEGAVREAKRGRGRVVVPGVVGAAEGIRRRVVGDRGREREKEKEKEGERDEMGELEMRWADWFVDAAKRGVLHLKVEGCTCRPEPLAEESDEEGAW